MSANVFGQSFGGSILELGNSAFGSEFLATCNTFGMKAFEDNFPSNVFSPTDLSGCLVWFDAADTSTIAFSTLYNDITQWNNKGTTAGQLEADGLTYALTNTHTVNGLNTVYFPDNSSLIMNGLTIDQLSRTIFITTKHLTDMETAPLPITGFFNSLTPNSLNCASTYDGGSNAFVYLICENGYRCGVTAAVGENPLNRVKVLCWGQTDENPPTGNIFTINGTSIVPLNDSYPASVYPLAPDNYYVNSSTLGTSQDMCEIIIYNRLLSPIERALVQTYLIAKWNAN